MSTAIAFDTYAYVRRLRDAGVDEAQAAIQADTLVTLVEDRLATKQDVADLKRDIALIEANLKRDIKEMDVRIVNVESNLKKDIAILDGKIEITKAELRKDVETAKVDIIKWVVVTGIAILGGVAAINRLVPPVPAYYQLPVQEMRQTAPLPAPSPTLPVPPLIPSR